MEIAKVETQDRAIAGAATALIIAALIFLAFLIRFFTPIPPFEPSLKEGIEVDFGTDAQGMGDDKSMVPFNPNDQNANTNNAGNPPTGDNNQLTQDDPQNPTVNNNNNPNPNPNPNPTDQNLLNALNNMTNDNPTNNSSDGNNDKPGNQGDPNGTNSNNYNGKPGEGGTGLNWTLKGRKKIQNPPPLSDFDEEGVIVVDITVNDKGKVIVAEVNRTKSKNPNYTLCSKARQAAFLTKFDEVPGKENANGTITFIFTLK